MIYLARTGMAGVLKLASESKTEGHKSRKGDITLFEGRDAVEPEDARQSTVLGCQRPFAGAWAARVLLKARRAAFVF